METGKENVTFKMVMDDCETKEKYFTLSYVFDISLKIFFFSFV